MKTFLSDIFPKIQRYSEKLDNLTLLTNQHWVSLDNLLSTKTVYIFRANNQLLVSTNGKVEKATWEYLGNKSLLIDKTDNSYLFKHGFFDDNILALKVDSREEYAVFVNENKYDEELNSIERVIEFLEHKYLDPSIKLTVDTTTGQAMYPPEPNSKTHHTKEGPSHLKPSPFGHFTTDKGEIKVELELGKVAIKNKVYQNNKPAKDGKYKLGFMNYLIIKNGAITDIIKQG